MKKKKNLTKIIGLAMLLIVCIGALIMWVQYTVSQNVVSCYIAKTNIEPYTTIDNSNFMNYFEETTIHKTMYENLKNPVTSKDQIINYETKSLIVQGYPLDSSLFQKKSNATYTGIKDPVKITLPVNSEKVDTSILKKGKTVTMIGYMNSTSSVTDDQGNKVKDDAWVGILTNNAIVYSVKTDKNSAIESATFVIESAVYSSVLMLSENYTIYFLEGSLNDISDSKSDIVKDLYNQSGTAASQGFSITNSDLNFDIQEVKNNIPTHFATGKDANYTDYTETNEITQKVSYFTLSGKEGIDITWTGSTSSAFIYHYTKDGLRGNKYGLYTKTSTDNAKNSYSILYNSITCENSFSQLISDKGFYQIIFDIKNPNYGQKRINAAGIEIDEPFYIHKIINFVIDESEEENKTTNNFKLTIDTLNNNTLIYELDKTKDWFENIDLMKDYSDNFELKNDEIIKKEIVSSNNRSIPIFEKNKKETTGITPVNSQIDSLKALFNSTDFNNAIDNIIKTKKLYDKNEVNNIIKTLNGYSEFKESYTNEEKWIVLYSLGYEITDETLITKIINVLKTKTDATNTGIITVVPELVITLKKDKKISITILINENLKKGNFL